MLLAADGSLTVHAECMPCTEQTSLLEITDFKLEEDLAGSCALIEHSWVKTRPA